jgi:hypothetical protein
MSMAENFAELFEMKVQWFQVQLSPEQSYESSLTTS